MIPNLISSNTAFSNVVSYHQTKCEKPEFKYNNSFLTNLLEYISSRSFKIRALKRSMRVIEKV